MRTSVSPLAPYKGTGWGLGRPAKQTKTQKEQGTRAGPLPRPVTARFPASTVRHPKRMEAAWRAYRTEAADGGTPPHPVIVGSGRLEDHASMPPSVYGEGANCPYFPYWEGADVLPFRIKNHPRP